MNKQPQQLRLAYFALLPSLSSGIICVALSLIIVLSKTWPFITHNPLLYQYLFGPEGLTQGAQLKPPDTLTDWYGLAVHYQFQRGFVFSYLIIALMGAASYSILEAGWQAAIRTKQIRYGLRGLHPASKKQAIRDLAWRTLLRLGALLSSFFYVFYIMRTIVPYAIAQSRFGIATAQEVSHIGYILLASATLCIGFHGFVVLVRLFLLRPRIFDGTDVLLRSESK